MNDLTRGLDLFYNLPLFPPKDLSQILPFCSPILKYRLQMLPSDGNWTDFLTRNTLDASELTRRLFNARACTLISFDYFTVLDEETFLAHFQLNIDDASLEGPLYSILSLCINEIDNNLEWKLFEINTAMPARVGAPIKTLADLKTTKIRREQGLSIFRSQPSVGAEINQTDAEDKYWNSYTESELGSPVEQLSKVAVTEESHYAQYDGVETAITDAPGPTNTIIHPEFTDAQSAVLHHVKLTIRNIRNLCHGIGITDEQFKSAANEEIVGALDEKSPLADGVGLSI